MLQVAPRTDRPHVFRPLVDALASQRFDERRSPEFNVHCRFLTEGLQMGHRDYRIVVLNTHGHWSASFTDAPERGFGGATARDAAQRLIKAAGRLDLNEENVLEIGSTAADGRLDLVVRVSGCD